MATARPEPGEGAEEAEAGGSRLLRAIRVYFAARGAGRDPADVLGSAPADLRDLLQPMLGPEPEDADAEELAPELAGRVLGGFRLLREIGRGGMGVVYEALQVDLGRRVALKVLPEHARTQQALARLKHEALTIARLEHSGIVKVLAVGEDEGTPWFAMELVRGRSLQNELAALRAQRRLDAGHYRRAARIVAEVADALAHTHAQGIVHRDVKPSNILLDDADRAVLTDFGLARDVDLAITMGGGGTPFYTAPEVFAGQPADARSDVFALGVTLYELSTLARPFEGGSFTAVQRAIALADPVDPQRLAPGLPPALAAITLQALAKEPPRRYAGATAMAADLRAFLADQPVRARREGWLDRARRFARREPAKALLALTLAVLVPALASTIGYLVARQPELRAGERRLLESWIDEGFEAQASSDRDQGRAFAAFARVLEREPENIEAIAGQVMGMLRWRQPGRSALELLDQKRHLEARAPVLQRLRVLALVSQGEREVGRRLLADLGPPHEYLEHYVDAVTRMSLADGDVGVWQDYLRRLSLAARLAPRPQLGLYSAIALAAIECGTPGERDEIARALQLLWPGSPNAHKVAGMVLENVDDARALAAYGRALELWSGFDHARYLRARLLLRTGAAAVAVADLRVLVDGESATNAPMHELLAQALEQSGDPQAAAAARADAARLRTATPATR